MVVLLDAKLQAQGAHFFPQVRMALSKRGPQRLKPRGKLLHANCGVIPPTSNALHIVDVHADRRSLRKDVRHRSPIAQDAGTQFWITN